MYILALLLWVTTALAGVPHASREAGPSFPVATNGQPFPWNKMRLPQAVSPLHYELLIHPNLTSLDFSGSVKIQMEVHEETNTIVLHSKDLNITKAALLGSAEGQGQIVKVLEYPAYQQITLVSDSTVLKKGAIYFIELEFVAKLSESFYGFYKSTYRTREGEER